MPEDIDLEAQPNAEGDVEVEIVDDVAAEDKPRAAPINAEAALASMPEHPDTPEEASERIRKRINALTFEKREALRQLAEQQREREALTSFTQNVHLSAKQLADRATRAEAAWKAEAAARREAELKLQQAKFVTAREANDAATEAEISAAMAKISAERAEVDRFQPQQFNIPDLPAFQQPATQPQPQAPQITTDDAAWLQRNPWFAAEGNDDLKAFAIAYEESLERKGLQRGTSECYKELDASLRKAFPERFDDKSASATPKRTSPVVGAQRASGARTGAKVTLTASEAAIARKLGVSYQDYAKYKGQA